MAFVALCIALGGTSLGAPARDAARRLITGKSIKDGSIGTKDLSRTARRRLRGRRGAAGAPGSVGQVGPAGPVGLTYVKSPTTTVAASTPPGTATGYTVGCPSSAPNVVSGGLTTSLTDDLRLTDSSPSDGADSDGIPDDAWSIGVRNTGTSAQSLTAYAICTKATSVAEAAG